MFFVPFSGIISGLFGCILTMTDTKIAFDPGEEIFAWEAYDYHPHRRGWLWMVLFCLVLFGGALWALISEGDWVMALTFFSIAALYFWVHRSGEDLHRVRVFERAVVIDQEILALESLSGYWFVYDEGVSVLNLQFKKGGDRRRSLQMGKNEPNYFRSGFAQVDLPELEDKHESLVDLWIRALKL